MASKFTSYVAVDPNEQQDLKESLMMMKSRDVPVQFALGRGGLSTDSECADGFSSEEGKKFASQGFYFHSIVYSLLKYKSY